MNVLVVGGIILLTAPTPPALFLSGLQGLPAPKAEHIHRLLEASCHLLLLSFPSPPIWMPSSPFTFLGATWTFLEPVTLSHMLKGGMRFVQETAWRVVDATINSLLYSVALS